MFGLPYPQNANTLERGPVWGGMEPEEEWWEPSDAELEDLIEDRLAEGPLDSEPMTWPPLSFSPIVLVMIGFVLGLLVCSFG